MKNIITTILVLFALVVNAQDRDTFTICNNVKVYTYCDTLVKYVRIESDSALFKQGSLSEINGVWLSINKSDSINRLFLDEDINYLDFTEELLDTLSMRWCGELLERTPTGLKQDTVFSCCNETPRTVDSIEALGFIFIDTCCTIIWQRWPNGKFSAMKQDTIYDFGTHTPKEIDSLEEAGHVVIRRLGLAFDYRLAGSLKLYSVEYDTIEESGLGLYLSNEDFEYGVDFILLPTIKTVVKCKNCFTQTYHHNGFRFTANETLKARQLKISTKSKGKCLNCPAIYEWQEVDLTKYKEFIFIEKPK